MAKVTLFGAFAFLLCCAGVYYASQLLLVQGLDDGSHSFAKGAFRKLIADAAAETAAAAAAAGHVTGPLAHTKRKRRHKTHKRRLTHAAARAEAAAASATASSSASAFCFL